MGLVWDFSPYTAHVPFLQISYYSFTIILVSTSSSYFTLAVPIREVSFVHGIHTRSLLSILNGLLYFVFFNDFVLTIDCYKPAIL